MSSPAIPSPTAASVGTPQRRLARVGDLLRLRAASFFAAIVAAVALVPSAWAIHSQSFAIFGRDQGIFQYVAWALRNGERVYLDIHEINGPLPHAWHTVMQLVGGEDEHVFRSIDTVLLVATYAFVATTIPRWVGLELGSGRTRLRAILAWGFAGIAVLGAQYTHYDWWNTAQREGLYSLLIAVSIALQAIIHTTDDTRRALVLSFFAGIATSLPWFGKPPCAVFSLLQLLVLVADRKNVSTSVVRIVASFAAGAFVVGVAIAAFVLAYEDWRRGIEILSKVPQLHHTIWNKTLLGAYRSYNNAPRLDWAFATFVAFALTYFAFRLPRRALLATILPVGGLVVFAGQGKGFPYHMHMLTLGTSIGQLVIVAALAKQVKQANAATGSTARFATTGPRRDALAIVCALASLGLGIKAAEEAWTSPGVRGRWAIVGATPEKRQGRAYLAKFPWGDYFAADLRDAAAYLRERTTPDERVQVYGFDPYLLFLARRRSASPVLYNFELNVDAALEGGPGARPSADLRSWLVSYRSDAERIVRRAVEASPPAAFALLDRAPFTHPTNAEEDFAEHCPDLYAWMAARYTLGATFGTVRIWLRRDVMSRPTLR